MKIAVYAIAKNEAKFAERWYRNMSEADEVCVLDTGSIDGTPDIFRKLGAKVEEWKHNPPFDFAAARNAAMKMASQDADILVCTDIDELFTEGWADKVRKAFEDNPDATVASCRFITKFAPDGKPLDVMHYWKIHRRTSGAKWNARVHEFLTHENSREIYIDDIHLEHHPDPSKSREQYIDLLRMEVDAKGDPRSLHYYGRELMYHCYYHMAIKQFKKHLAHKDSTWTDERAFSMRYIGRCYGWLKDYDASVAWFLRSICTGKDMREPCCDLADLAMTMKDWGVCKWAAEEALRRNVRNTHYFTEEPCWTYQPHDVLSVALYNLGDYSGALAHAEEALKFKPDDERIRKNVATMKDAINGNDKEVPNGRED